MGGDAVGGEWDKMVAHFNGRKDSFGRSFNDYVLSHKKGESIPSDELDWVEVVNITPELLQGMLGKTLNIAHLT